MFNVKGARCAERVFDMRFKLLGIMVGGLMLALTPAAASAAEIDCIVERTPAPLKAEVDAIAVNIVADSQGTPGGEATIATKLVAQRDACAKAYRWSDAKAKAATDYAIATLLRGVLVRNLATNNISKATVDRVIAANAALFDPQAGAPDPTDEQRAKVVTDARAAGLPLDDPKKADLIFTYFGAVAVSNQIRHEFEGA